MTFQLYNYQKELVDRARQSYVNGYNSPCIVLGCGGGKSVIIAEVIKKTTDKKKRVLFLVHRTELKEQIRKTLVKHGVNMDFVELSMVMTIVRRLDKTQRPDLIVVDENHHVLANSYRKILNYFNTHVLGFTATPIRLNGDGLGDINDVLLEGPSVKWLIENKRLSPYKYFSVDLTDASVLKKSSTGDFTNKSMDASLGDVIYGDVIENYKKIADGKKAILYAHNVKYSKMFAEKFNEAGILARHIEAKTPTFERDQAVEEFRQGKIKILSNVDILGEGFDVPDCEVVIMVRPTASLSLFIQQAMRPMRYQPNKTAIIIDHVANVYRHGFPDSERTWSLGKRDRNKRTEVGTYLVHTCERCFQTYPKSKLITFTEVINGEEMKIEECPYCEYKRIVENLSQKKIDEDAKLQEVKKEDVMKNYYKRRNWRDARSYDELLQMADAKGYKRGWAAFKAYDLNLSDTPIWVYKYKQNQKQIIIKEFEYYDV